MTWQDIAIPIVRILVNDYNDASYDYNDDRLTQTLVVAAYLIDQEIDFSTSYTINVPLETISPDPSSDTAFINFMSLKAACIIDQSTFRTKATIAGLKAKLGPAVLETVEHLKGFKELLTTGPCAAYEALKDDYIFGNAQVVEAILSPFISNNFDPENLVTTRYLDDPRAGYHYY